MKVAVPKSRVSYLVSALLAIGFCCQAVAAPRPAESKVTLGSTTARVQASQPSTTEEGFGLKAKNQTNGLFTQPLNGGMTQWQNNGRNIMFSESFWNPSGPGSQTDPDWFWMGNTGPRQGSQEVSPGGSLINENPRGDNTIDARILVTLFAFTDLNTSIFGFVGNRAAGRSNGTHPETVETGRAKVPVTDPGASGFELMHLGSEPFENGGIHSLIDLLNRPELAADFLNVEPEDLPEFAVFTDVMEWSNIELPGFGFHEIAVARVFEVPEPGSLGLLMAPLLAGLGLRRGKRRA